MSGIAALGGVVLVTLVLAASAAAQEKPLAPDLRALAAGKGGPVPPEATLAWVEDARGRPALHVQSRKDDTVVLLDGVTLGNGTIDVDVLGQSGPPQSNFLGIAFRVADAQRHDAVYLRPFNFRAPTPEQRSHAVQYISAPLYHWEVLRTTHPGEYEKPIEPPPDGDSWVHLRILLEKPQVRVYVNGAAEPSLIVNELSERSGGAVGLWVGPGVGGYFANVKITPAR
ncbi:MAG TPA: hypothetical protein VF832_17865 [Longimicrobiales bacterium]